MSTTDQNYKKWEGIGYDKSGNKLYELKKGNGKVREYDNEGLMIFKGEYLDGRRNGKGKEYEYGKLIFDGEYKYGVRNGKGREYRNGKLIFEGEYKYGKKLC